MMCAHEEICHMTHGNCKHPDSNLSLEEQLRISGSQFDQLERENARVVMQLKEVIKMNNHWQRYNSQREEYVLKLTKTNQELQYQVRDLQKQVRNFNATGRACTRPVNSDCVIGLADTTEELSSEQSPSSTNKDNMATAVKDYISKLEEKIKIFENRKAGEDDELTMLRAQINVCVEDFRQERQDRERIHSENQKLRERLGQSQQIIRRHENQIVKCQEQIKKLQEKCQLRPTSQSSVRPNHDQPWCFQQERSRLQERNSHKTRNIFRHPIYTDVDLTDLPSDLEIDGVPDEPEDIPDGPEDMPDGPEDMPNGHFPTGAEALVSDEVTEVENQENEIDDEPLQCPRCLASFHMNKHNELLTHINVCLD